MDEITFGNTRGPRCKTRPIKAKVTFRPSQDRIFPITPTAPKRLTRAQVKKHKMLDSEFPNLCKKRKVDNDSDRGGNIKTKQEEAKRSQTHQAQGSQPIEEAKGNPCSCSRSTLT